MTDSAAAAPNALGNLELAIQVAQATDAARSPSFPRIDERINGHTRAILKEACETIRVKRGKTYEMASRESRQLKLEEMEWLARSEETLGAVQKALGSVGEPQAEDLLHAALEATKGLLRGKRNHDDYRRSIAASS